MAKKKNLIEDSGNAIEITELETPAAPPDQDAPAPEPGPIYGYNKKYRDQYSFGPAGSYFDQRMKQLGVTSKLNTIQVYKEALKADLIDGQRISNQWIEESLFYEMDNGNIGIRYLDIEGKPQTYKPDDEDTGTINEPGAKRGNRKVFIRWRLHPGNIPVDKPDFKYGQPKESSVHIFYPPALIAKCRDIEVESIDTLYMVEGEFKAWAGSLAGLDIIGLPSMNAYRLKEETALHPDILRVIFKLNPKRLVYLVDADALSIKWEKWELDIENYDLAKRLNIFHSAAKNIMKYTENLDCEVFYADQTPTLNNKDPEIRSAKGLDDLLTIADKAEVITDLQRFTEARRFFSYINLSKSGQNTLRQYFMLTLIKRVPKGFFETYRDKLVSKYNEPEIEFLFNGFRYKYDKSEDELKCTGHPDSDKFLRVGPKYFKLIHVPNSKKQLSRRIEPWSPGELSRDYVQNGYKDFFMNVPKYDAFCNVPCNDDKYQQVVNECYNLYYKIDHVPAPGEHKTISAYLDHLFGPKIDIALDYLTLMYREPTQKLPILCLVSRERGTGKSTLYELFSLLFLENATKIGNDEINDRFNDDFISKLLIFIDEGFIDKKVVLEKIKSLSTSDTANLATKNVSRNKIDFFGKFVIASNDENNFIQIDNEEVRFFVVKVKPFEKEEPDLVKKMQPEVPAFLYKLKTRTLSYPKVSRHWFASDVLKTEALTNIMENTRSVAYKAIRNMIRDKMIEFEETELRLPLWHIDMLLKSETAYRITKDKIMQVLKDDFKLEPNVSERYTFPEWEQYTPIGETEPVLQRKDAKFFIDPQTRAVKKFLGRCYIFHAKDFLTTQDLSPAMLTRLEAIAEAATTTPDEDLPF